MTYNHQLDAAARLASSEAIEALRNGRFDTDQPPGDVDQFSTLVDCIADASRPREEIEKLCGMDTGQVVQAIIDLAGHMLRSKGNPEVVPVGTWSEVYASADALPLPGMTNVVPDRASKKKRKAGEDNVVSASGSTASAVEQLALDGSAHKVAPRSTRARKPLATPVGTVVLPDGFAPSEIGKDIKSSIAALAAFRPKTEEIQRYLNRRYSRPVVPLTFEFVCSVWAFAQLGRLDGLAAVSPTENFARNAVAAWDTLEVARRDAMEALGVITGAVEGDMSLAVSALSAVWEAEALKLERLLSVTSTSSSAFRRECSWMAKRVAAGQLVVRDIAELNEGQVRRICQAAGIDTESISRTEETAIRQRLANLGLERDADQLVGTGVRAVRAGVPELFWDACQRRIAGEANWDEEVTMALGAV